MTSPPKLREQHPKTIQALVGHKGISETMDTYGHLFSDEHETARASIGAALRPAPTGLRLVEGER